MARRTFPDDQLAYALVGADNAVFRSSSGTTVRIYTDSAATTLANITDMSDVAVANAQLTVDSNSLLPLFKGPNDDSDTLYARKADGTGTISPIYARVDDRFDGPFLPSAGTSAAPAYSFSGDTDLGIYRRAANVLNVASTLAFVSNAPTTYFGVSGYEATHINSVVMVGGGTSIIDLTGQTAASPNMWGIVSGPRIAVNASGITNCAAIFANGPTTQSDSPGTGRTITNLEGILVENPGASKSADITATNVYGIKILEATGGATSSYSLYSAGAVRIEGKSLTGMSHVGIAGSGFPQASAGDLRFGKDGTITARNSADSADITLIKLSADQVHVGTGTAFVVSAGTQTVVQSGTVGAPGLTFDADTDTGIFRNAANIFTLAAAGAAVLSIQSGTLTVGEATNLSIGTATGTKIGTATTQKIGFWNATPVVQPTAVADATDAASAITQLNALLARCRTTGLIAT